MAVSWAQQVIIKTQYMPEPIDYKGAQILIVEDSLTQAEYLRRTLEDNGLTPSLCFDALEAVEFLDKNLSDLIISDILMPNLDGFRFGISMSLIIRTDILMPNLDGFRFCRYLKSTEKLKDIPIMLVTAMSEIDKLEQAFKAGADDYVAKPIDEIELFARVHSLLDIKFERQKRIKREQELVKLRRDIEDKTKIFEELSITDELTGLTNRRYFNEMLATEWKRAVRQKTELSLLLIDIDHFKAYNDFYGHKDGDNCLKQISMAMKSVLQRPADLLARFGGEEFVAVLPETDHKGALFIAEKIRNSVAELEITHKGVNEHKYVTVSIGLATSSPTSEEEKEKLLGTADKRLYEAKSRGRNLVLGD